MRWLGIGLGAVVALVLLVVAVVMGASEFGGEVVTLVTFDEEGVPHRTSLWVAEDEGALWLRAGDPASAWLARLRQRPEVELERAGESGRYRATPQPEHSARLNELLAERYGWADRVIDTTLDVSDATAVRLDRVR